MIENDEIAKDISRLMLDTSRKLDQSLITVRKDCPQEEFLAYRTAVGRILGTILVEVLNPLFERHPELEPPDPPGSDSPS